ncbi:hypothetical protein CLI64_07510 [Nostoc sp. CENA543]|uniref:hypothetical protein n=1 Tax=Nostoc sp. CENA543 TaxID=1869241 RepID=UPI000CA1EADC|nr:hypothetical protein [Nostoc sp. CENA543]AUT00240.1 hypothetical protein CLI64_07510 [Nostoc sp. CENA543]
MIISDEGNGNRKVTIDVLPTAKQVSDVSVRQGANSIEPQNGTLQEIVNSAIGEVLGRNINANDPKTVLTSLKQSFAPQDSNGRTTYVWNPYTYAVQTERGGALTGAQASLYHRAKAALESILPLLNGLMPLNPAADIQNMEAVRSIVRTEISELVNEIRLEGGPRILKVDNLFALLLGADLSGAEVGQLKNMANIFGFERNFINTVAEEQNYTNYLTILDYVISLNQSWARYKQETRDEKYLGTQLVKLSRALCVVAESVNEVYRIMDSVFLGFAERQTVIIKFRKRNSSTTEGYFSDNQDMELSLEELLSWVKEFATFEGQALAKGGGKLAIAEVVKETAKQLADLVTATSDAPISHSAFKRAGVIDSLKDLADQLREVSTLAGQVKREQNINVPSPAILNPPSQQFPPQ